MEIINFFTDASAWEKDELFFPLKRYFGPCSNNPFDGKGNSEIKRAFLEAIHADSFPIYEYSVIKNLERGLEKEAKRFTEVFSAMLPPDFKILLFPMKDDWSYVIENLGGTWGVTFPKCVVLCAHPSTDLSRLLRTLHHETNHSIRLQFIEDDHNFLDRIILEGLAEVYVDEMFPHDSPSNFVTGVSTSEIERWLHRFSEFWLAKDFKFEDYKVFLYGSQEQKIPKWLGYAVGYFLVKLARQNQFKTLPWNELIKKSAISFIQSSSLSPSI